MTFLRTLSFIESDNLLNNVPISNVLQSGILFNNRYAARSNEKDIVCDDARKQNRNSARFYVLKRFGLLLKVTDTWFLIFKNIFCSWFTLFLYWTLSAMPFEPNSCMHQHFNASYLKPEEQHWMLGTEYGEKYIYYKTIWILTIHIAKFISFNIQICHSCQHMQGVEVIWLSWKAKVNSVHLSNTKSEYLVTKLTDTLE